MVSEETAYLPAGAGPHRITNETLLIGLSQAKFPGTVGHPTASHLWESPSEQHMSSVAFFSLGMYRPAWYPLPCDQLAVSMGLLLCDSRWREGI